MKRVFLPLLLASILSGCDGATPVNTSEQTQPPVVEQPLATPILDEQALFKVTGLPTFKQYKLDNGHGFYLTEKGQASIEFRTEGDKTSYINLSFWVFSEAGTEAKNVKAQEVITKMAAAITGTDGAFIADVVSGEMPIGVHEVNGLSVRVIGGDPIMKLISISQQ